MDPWRYLSDGKNLLLSEDLDNLPVDGLVRSKDTSMDWETKPSYGIESYPPPTNSVAVENSGLMELGFSGLAQRSYSSEPSGDMSSDDIGVESFKNLSSVALNTPNLVASGEESSCRISSFFMDSNRQDSMRFDLKLGGLPDSRNAKDSQVFREGTSKLSSVSSSPSSAKRGRSTNPCLQAPLCQVHGCNKDLSSFKDYYKRHKVCEAHTKTAKVIVNGIEQRFCQQCSRFHLTAEFDEGKRSCRKRLADHNERRRKPQLTAGPGSRFLESSMSRGSSSALSDMLPTDTFGCGKYENEEMKKHINFEVPTSSLNVVPDNLSSGLREKMFGMGACSVQDVQDSSCALSLLSDPAPNISSQLLRSQSTSQLMTQMRWDGQGADKIPMDSIMNDSIFTDYQDSHHPGGGTMVNLDQLSSHLQRVEQQRNSEQVGPPDTVFGTFPGSKRE